MSGRVIFLDVDGVLNSRGWTERRGPVTRQMPLEQRRTASFDPLAIARINRLVAQSGARIVLSSQWRRRGVEAMRDVLARAGLEGHILDRTPLPTEHDLELFRRLHGSERPDRPEPSIWPRGYEIQQWLDAHEGITGIVLVDDSSSMRHLAAWQVRTSMDDGLLDVHVEQALAVLQRPPPPRSGRGSKRAAISERAARRVVFLDIDGVLNTRESRLDHAADRGFDRTCVARLNRLVEQTGAEVVLSSSWRTFVAPEEAQAMLERVGFVGRLVDRTPRRTELDPSVHRRLSGTEPPADVRWPRGYEIQQWLDAHDDVEGIVILDDRDDMHHLSPWLVRTRFAEGLRDEHVDEAVRRLAAQAPSRSAAATHPAPAPLRTSAERFVFLDVDGVLNHARSQARNEGRWRDLDPEAVTRLDRVLERTGAVVVLTSAWRKAVGVPEVQAKLEANGFRGEVLDRTPARDEHDLAVVERLGGAKAPRGTLAWPRGYEIQQWLDARASVKGVVILDEGHGMHHLEPWLVAIDHARGLQDDHIDRAVARLLAPPPPHRGQPPAKE